MGYRVTCLSMLEFCLFGLRKITIKAEVQMSGSEISRERTRQQDDDMLGSPNDAFPDLIFDVLPTPRHFTPCASPVPYTQGTPLPLLDLRGIANTARAMRAAELARSSAPPALVFSNSNCSLVHAPTVESVEAEFSNIKFSWVYPAASGASWSPRIAHRRNNHHLPPQKTALIAALVRDGVLRKNLSLWPTVKLQFPEDKYAILCAKYGQEIEHANEFMLEKLGNASNIAASNRKRRRPANCT